MFISLFITVLLFLSYNSAYELKQAIVLSRHNIRAPLVRDVESLSPKKWPSWTTDPGNLTPKGRRLEYIMGKYFSEWMIKEKLFDNNCPRDQVLIYANALPRTKESASSFARGAFGNCVDVYYKNITGYDPLFRAIVRNSSTEFKEAVLREINIKLNSTDLTSAFLELNRIVDFGNSSYCRTEKVCDLNKAKSEIEFEFNECPYFKGPLQIGRRLVDWFLMAYYDGMPTGDVAWGQIQTIKQWEKLMQISRAYFEVRLTIKTLVKDLLSPFLTYLTDIFRNGEKRLYVFVIHDVDFIGIMSSLGFVNYVLHGQLEKTPVGGKLVFQKWYDKENDRNLLRVNLMYLSTKQIRDGPEELQNPPQWQILEMENCAVDENGFCPWNDLISILDSV